MSIRHDMIRWLAAATAVLFAAAGASAQDVTWDGNGDPNNSGNWGVAANWDTDSVPTTSNRAILPSVTSGDRTVTVDDNYNVERVRFEQAGNTNNHILSLGGNLILTRSNASSTNAIWETSLSGGATAANIIVNMNGYRITIQNPVNTPSGGAILAGVFNFNQANSYIHYGGTGHWAASLNGTVYVTANGGFYRPSTSATGEANFDLSANTTITNNSKFFAWAGNVGSGTQDRGVWLRNSGNLTLDAGSDIEIRIDSTSTASRGNARFTNQATGNVTHSGAFRMKDKPESNSVITLTNNGIWTISGSAATIYRLNSGSSVYHIPSFTNNSNGTLRGSGDSDTLEYNEETYIGSRMTITNNGTIAPGAGSQGSGLASVGNLILRDIDVTMGSHANAKVVLDIGGTASGEFDRLSLMTGLTDPAGAGTLTLSGAGTLQLWKVNSFDPGTTPFSITLIQAGSVVGEFATVKLDNDTFVSNELDVGGGWKYSLTYNSDSVVLSYIPEPGTAGLALGGLVVALLRRRR